MRTALALAALALLGSPALGALQVSVAPEQVAPVTLGDARVWNAYVTVTVVRDGAPGEGASVELRGPAGALASGRADAAGKTVLPVLSREPLALEIWVDGADSGRRVELAGAGSPAPPPAASPPGTAAKFGGVPGWMAMAAAGVGALVAVFALSRVRRKKHFKRGN